MQKEVSFIKIGFLTFIIGGLFFSFVFAQERTTQMLDLLEGKDIGEGEGDELDFLLDELAEDNGFSLSTLTEEEDTKVNKKLQIKGEEGSLGNISKLKLKLLSLQDELEKVNQKNTSLKGDIKHLRRKLTIHRKHLSKEAAAKIYGELGVAYTQAKVYARAIEAYVTALRLDSRNSKAHHDLGLLYEHFLGDSNKAIYHLGQYLKLDPDPKDRERVAHLIKIIKREDIKDRIMY